MTLVSMVGGGPGRWTRWAITFGTQSYVLGRLATVATNERPLLARNGQAGIRFAAFLWSEMSTHVETLGHVPNAVNTGLSGITYWGTDIGGFVPTKNTPAIARSLVSVRRFLSTVSRSRPYLASASAMGLNTASSVLAKSQTTPVVQLIRSK